ncbi:MAG: hypothetical protein ABJN26_13475 [Stappiaceae bacterium]
MKINSALLLFSLVSISAAFFIFNAIKFRMYLNKYEKKDFFASLKGLITVDFDHPDFPKNDGMELRKKQKTHDRLFYVCIFCFALSVLFILVPQYL